MRILGISFGTIILVLVVAIVVRKFGGSIPLLNKVS